MTGPGYGGDGSGGFRPVDYGQTAPHQNYAPPQNYGQPGGSDFAPTSAYQVPGPGYGPPPPLPPARKSNRTLWIIAGIAAVVIVAVVATTLALVLGGDDDGASSAEDAVKTYLNALAAGDAAKALSVVKTPPSTKLLTNEILKKQQDTAKITDIKVYDSDGGLVKATYKFGNRNADIDILVRRSGGSWQLENGVLEIDPSYIEVPQLTLFGVDVSQEAKLYVFPGPLLWGSKNQYVTVSDEKSGEFPLGPESYFSVSSNVTPTLSEAGKTAVANAVNTYLTNCEGSREARASVDKPGCEQDTYASARPGSVRWTKPTRLDELTTRFDYSDATKVTVSGSVEWGISYVSNYGNTPETDTVTEYMNGSVDLTQNPPTYTAKS